MDWDDTDVIFIEMQHDYDRTLVYDLINGDINITCKSDIKAGLLPALIEESWDLHLKEDFLTAIR